MKETTNFKGAGTCTCGKTLNVGGANFSPRGAAVFRDCTCGIKSIFFKEAEGYELSFLIRKRETDDKSGGQ